MCSRSLITFAKYKVSMWMKNKNLDTVLARKTQRILITNDKLDLYCYNLYDYDKVPFQSELHL